MKLHKEICKVTSATIGFEHHGILTVMIGVEYGETVSQTIGGWALSTVNEPKHPAISVPLVGDLIIRLLRAFGVEKFHQLVGRTVFALFEGDHMPLNTMPDGFENLPTERGERFLFAEWQEQVLSADGAVVCDECGDTRTQHAIKRPRHVFKPRRL